MPEEKLSHGGMSYGEEQVAEAEQKYLELDLRNFPLDGDVTHGNDTILEAFEHGVEPKWHEINAGFALKALEDRMLDQSPAGARVTDWIPLIKEEDGAITADEDNVLAMSYVRDAASPYGIKLGELSTVLYGGRVGDLIIAQAIGHDPTYSNEILEERKRLAEEFLPFKEQNPDDWEQKAKGLLTVCSDMMEAGELRMAEGLRMGDEDAIAEGRRAMQASAEGVTDLMDPHNPLHHVAELRRMAMESQDPTEKAEAYTAAMGWMQSNAGGEESFRVTRLLAERMMLGESKAQRETAVTALIEQDGETLVQAFGQQKRAAA